MLDSGASANLIHPALASYLGLELSDISPLSVTLADGSTRQCTKTVADVSLTLEDKTTEEKKELKMKVYVADLPGCRHDIILGMPFLERENPVVDWLCRSLTFKTATKTGENVTIGASAAEARRPPSLFTSKIRFPRRCEEARISAW
jgi:Aspartyl protease